MALHVISNRFDVAVAETGTPHRVGDIVSSGALFWWVAACVRAPWVDQAHLRVGWALVMVRPRGASNMTVWSFHNP